MVSDTIHPKQKWDFWQTIYFDRKYFKDLKNVIIISYHNN